jgi:hypothetical protein
LEASFKEHVNELFLEVFGDTGQMVYQSAFQQVGTHWQYDLDLGEYQLTPGLYLIRLRTGLAVEERKIILIP